MTNGSGRDRVRWAGSTGPLIKTDGAAPCQQTTSQVEGQPSPTAACSRQSSGSWGGGGGQGSGLSQGGRGHCHPGFLEHQGGGPWERQPPAPACQEVTEDADPGALRSARVHPTDKRISPPSDPSSQGWRCHPSSSGQQALTSSLPDLDAEGGPGASPSAAGAGRQTDPHWSLRSRTACGRRRLTGYLEPEVK